MDFHLFITCYSYMVWKCFFLSIYLKFSIFDPLILECRKMVCVFFQKLLYFRKSQSCVFKTSQILYLYCKSMENFLKVSKFNLFTFRGVPFVQYVVHVSLFEIFYCVDLSLPVYLYRIIITFAIFETTRNF